MNDAGKDAISRRTFIKQAAAASALLSTNLVDIGRDATMTGKREVDVLLRGGVIYDGTGSEGVAGDVALCGDRIAAVGKFDVVSAARVIDCSGLVVAPGFIDLHTHSDRTITLPALRANENYLTQGCSTVVTGNCGLGPLDVGKYFEQMEKDGIGSNVIHLAAYSPIRKEGMGNADRHPTAEELLRLKELTDRAMRDGAWGMSTGLIYAWNIAADTDEIVEIAKVVASHGGLYASHIRSESDRFIEAVQETLEVGRRAGLPVHVSHFKACLKQNWGKLREAASIIEKARGQGQQATADQYPYIATSTSFVPAVVPIGAIPGGNKDLPQRMRNDPELDRQVREMLGKRLNGVKDILFCSCKKEAWKCRYLSEISASEKLDPVDVVLEIYCVGGGSVVSFSISEDDVRYGMTLPWVATASDGWGAGPSNAPIFHPRMFGTFPRKIGRYALELKALPLSQAIRSCTGLPSDILGLKDRGYLRADAFADVLVFDPGQFRDQATYEKPGVYSTGVRYLFINGKPAVNDGKIGKLLCGRALRHKSLIGPETDGSNRQKSNQ